MTRHIVLIGVAFAWPLHAKPGAQARTAIAAQAAAWNRGDLEASLASYCPTPDIVWVNRSGVSRGFDSFAKSMRDEFRDRPAAMGILSNEVLEARSLGRSSLLVVRWSITLDGRKLMGGVSTQIWATCRGATRIVFEHAS
jgi:ketosteroid isomerase-like protein